MKIDYQMKCLDLADALRLSDIRKNCMEHEISRLNKENQALKEELGNLKTSIGVDCE